MVVTPHPIAEGRPMSFRSINIYHRSEQKAILMIEITIYEHKRADRGHYNRVMSIRQQIDKGVKPWRISVH